MLHGWVKFRRPPTSSGDGGIGGANPPLSLTIEVADVGAVHAKAVARDVQIVYPLTNEPWGVRRFHVTDPKGMAINVMSHIK